MINRFIQLCIDMHILRQYENDIAEKEGKMHDWEMRDKKEILLSVNELSL